MVVGTAGVERHVITFTGEEAHAGSTPMPSRRDAFAAGARTALSIRDAAATIDGAVATVGRCDVLPGIVTIVPGTCALHVDQRHVDAGTLAQMHADARSASERIAAEEEVEVAWSPLWSIEPVWFDAALIELADETVAEVAKASHRMASGPLHDAAAVAREGVPAVMLFVQSLRGLSHSREEDTRPEHLELSVRALALTAEKVIRHVAGA